MAAAKSAFSSATQLLFLESEALPGRRQPAFLESSALLGRRQLAARFSLWGPWIVVLHSFVVD
jgi:hypothetical protein